MTTIVMTGGTSGFGKVTVKQLIRLPDTRIFLGARRNGPKGIETLSLDLTKLENVRSFASEVCNRIGRDEIDALVLNAGLSIHGGSKTPDGFETTFAVNHLAHYLLLRLLLPKLAYGAKIVLTTSGTHDPAEKTIIPPPIHANANLLAHPELDPNIDQDLITAGGRAYSSSKLCVVLTARKLAMSPEALKKEWTVIAYDPGPTPGTGLLRNNNLIIRLVWCILGFPLLRLLLPKMNSRLRSGCTLADLSLGNISPPEDQVYAALRRGNITWPKLSELARHNDLMESLWRDSATLVGLD